MIEIKQKVNFPKWKWWQYTILFIATILALKIDPNHAFEMLNRIVDMVVERWL